MTARVGVSVCGAVALVVLARAAAYYARTDALALALVVTMTVALVGAIAELLARVSRVERVARELAALPRPATLAAVERASPELGPLLRARMAHAAGSVGSAPLAGYVVGLLVMLGLLGTFLGLFETLRGAREALTSSGDVEGLRASLAAPMQGLTRSFGTSAAGVSASAMLGLASALARQAESRFAQALGAYAAVALAPLTLQGRQLEAIERLARYGEALPKGVGALEAAAARLASLETSWGAAQAEASAETAKAMRGVAESVRRDLEQAVARAGSAAEQALAPLVARAVEGSVATVRQHVLDLRASLDADLVARRADDATRGRAHEEALGRIAASEETRAQALASLWAGATRALETSVAATDARGKARDAAFAQTAGEIASAARTAVEAAGERLERAVESTSATARQHVVDIAASLDADRADRRAGDASHARARDEAIARIAAAEENRAKTLASLWADATRALETSVAATDARGQARDAAFAKAAGEVAKAARAAVESAAEHLAQADARAVAQATQLGAVVAAIDARTQAATALAGEQRAAVDALLEMAAARVEALDAQTRAGHAALVAEVRRGVEEHTARAADLEREVGATLASHAERLVAAMGAHAEEREGELEAVATSVREAAAGVEAGGAELAAVAEMFAGAVDRHREGAAEWLAALGTVEGAIARAGEDAAGRALGEQLERARELFDVQLQFHRELLLQLRGAHLASEPRREHRQDEDAPA